MNSTHQARPKSTPKKVTMAGSTKCCPTVSTRCTPDKKVMPSIQNQVPFKAATG